MASFGGLQIDSCKSKKSSDTGAAQGEIDFTVPAGKQCIVTHARYSGSHANSVLEIVAANGGTLTLASGAQDFLLVGHLILGPGDRFHMIGKGTLYPSGGNAFCECVAVYQANS